MSETDTTQKGVERALMAALDKAISINQLLLLPMCVASGIGIAALNPKMSLHD